MGNPLDLEKGLPIIRSKIWSGLLPLIQTPNTPGVNWGNGLRKDCISQAFYGCENLDECYRIDVANRVSADS